MASHSPPDAVLQPIRSRGPIALLFDLFSSVRFGITLLVILFFYMSIGSAGLLYPTHPNIFHPDAWVHAQIRQWRPFEMTEFEWFHWWPFDILMVLIAINIMVTTLRRIPFKPVHYGVWTIHTGVILTIIGCFIYFGTKVEGDSPIPRRRIIAEVLSTAPDGTVTVIDRSEVVASPGQRVAVGTPERRYDLEVTTIDPTWSMRSDATEGLEAYSIQVQVTPSGPATDGKPFVRQLLAGHPEHTEDVILTNDPSQPMQRAIKATGHPLVDTSIRLSLDYDPQEWLFERTDLQKAFALYVRKPGERVWTMRPMPSMPLYNDYVGSRDQVFQAADDTPLPIDPIDIAIPPAEHDPFPDLTLHATGYLRYAVERSRFIAGGPGAPLYPVAWVTLAADGGQATEVRLEALDPQHNKGENGLLQFRMVRDEAELAALLLPPALAFKVPSLGIDLREPVREAAAATPEAPFRPIGEADSGYAYRVVTVQDDLALANGRASVAILELRTPKGEFRRWVFDDPTLSRDVTEALLRGAQAQERTILDDTIEVLYEPGHGLSLLLLVAGPEPEQLRLVTALGEGAGTVHPIAARQPFRLPAGIAVTVGDYMPRAVRETKPFLVPPAQRDRDAGTQFSNARIEIPGVGAEWLGYHHYVFDGETDVLRRHRYRPLTVTLPDGRGMELMFSRTRKPLPNPVALEEFVLSAHVGGFTGETSTIRDYMSVVRFRGADGSWGAPQEVSVNRPIVDGDYSFFQAQWDPPDAARFEGDRASMGLNYTVLGVGNRHGVWTMLAGTVIACLGMLYAFYIKPIIKRRQREAVHALLERGGAPAIRNDAGSRNRPVTAAISAEAQP